MAGPLHWLAGMKGLVGRRVARVAVFALAAALFGWTTHAQQHEAEEERRGIRVYPEGEVAQPEPVEGVIEDEQGRGVIRVYPDGEVPPPEPVEGVIEDEEGRGMIRVYPGEAIDSIDEAEAPRDEVWVPIKAPETPSWARRAERERADGLACFLEASDTTLLDDEQALRLCELAPTPGPTACYRRAQRETTLREDQSIALCRCATTTRAVDCVRKAESETFLDRAQVIELCRATSVERRYRDCSPMYGAPARDDWTRVPSR